MRARSWRRPALAALLALCFAACGNETSAAERSTPIRPLSVDAVPQELVGLDVRVEHVNDSLKAIDRTYVDAVALYSLRTDDDVVQATLQINRFKNEERYTTTGFRRTIVSLIGSRTPRATTMADQTVWRTTDTKQRVAVWFRGRHMFLLSVREDFQKPRTLIREALELQP